jgi:hypothetical protein
MNVDAHGGAAFWRYLLAVANVLEPRCSGVDEACWQYDGCCDHWSCERAATHFVHTGYDPDIGTLGFKE